MHWAGDGRSHHCGGRFFFFLCFGPFINGNLLSLVPFFIRFFFSLFFWGLSDAGFPDRIGVEIHLGMENHGFSTAAWGTARAQARTATYPCNPDGSLLRVPQNWQSPKTLGTQPTATSWIAEIRTCQGLLPQNLNAFIFDIQLLNGILFESGDSLTSVSVMHDLGTKLQHPLSLEEVIRLSFARFI